MKRRQSGFTLFELMIGLGIMGILLGLAVPSFQEYGRNSRVLAFQNDLVTAFNYARNEAIRRSSPVTVCATTNFTACSSTPGNFRIGWLVFTDEAGATGSIDAGDTILQMWEGQAMNGLSMTVTGTSAQWVQFTPTGLANPIATDKTYLLKSSSCPTGQLRQRRININGIGAIRSERVAC